MANIIEVLRVTKIEQLRLSPALVAKLQQAGYLDVSKIYRLLQSYKAFGASMADGFDPEELAILQEKITELLVLNGLAKAPIKPRPATQSARNSSRESPKPALLPKKSVSAISTKKAFVPDQSASPEGIEHKPSKLSPPDFEPATNSASKSKISSVHKNNSLKQSGLSGWEQRLRPLLQNVRLVSEIEFTQAEIEEISQEFATFFSFVKDWDRAVSKDRLLEVIENHYPASFAVFLVGQGIFGYKGGEYWPAIASAIHQTVDGNFGYLFEKILRRFGLPIFTELQERAHRYVSLILAHGGIPFYCLKDYFEEIVLPGVARPQLMGLSSAEYVEEIIQNSAHRQNIYKPIINFLEFGGATAQNLLDRSRKLLIMWQQDHIELPLEEAGLPPHVRQFFYEWVKQDKVHGDSEHRVRNRIKKPEFCLDPWGLGLFFRFPAQSLSTLTGESPEWVVEIGNQQETPRIRIRQYRDHLETNEVLLRITQIIEVYKVSFQNGGGVYHWNFNGISEMHPFLCFDPDQGVLQNHLNTGENWIIYPADLNLYITSGSAHITEELPRLPGEWADCQAECWDLSDAQTLEFRKGNQIVCEVIVRGHEKEMPPSLGGGTVLQTDPLESSVPVYVGKAPNICIPLTKADQLDQELSYWRMKIVPVNEAVPALPTFIRLADLPSNAVSVNDRQAMIDLNCQALLGARPCGTFMIQLLGPIGLDADFTISIVPEFYVQGLEQLYVPNWQTGGLLAHLSISTGLTDHLDRQNLIEGVNIHANRPGSYSVEIPGIVSTVKLILLRDAPDLQVVKVPINLRLNRLRWRFISTNEITEKWSDTILALPAKAFLQASFPTLLVDLPVENEDTTLSLHLLDLNGVEQGSSLSTKTRKNGRKERFRRFDLNVWADTIRQSPSPFLRVELRRESSNNKKNLVIPTVSLSQEIQISNLEIDFYATPEYFRISLTWEETIHLQSRVIYLWSLFRPWQAPIVEKIPDCAVGGYEFLVSRKDLHGSLFRVVFSMIDPWVNAAPLVNPPAAGGSASIDVELVSPIERMKDLDKWQVSKIRLGTEITNRLEAYLTRQQLGETENSKRDLEWCCSNLEMMSPREILIFKNIQAEAGIEEIKEIFRRKLSQPSVLQKLLDEANTGALLHDDVVEILRGLPLPKSWTMETCEQLIRVEDPIIRIRALNRAINLNVRQGCTLLMKIIEREQIVEEVAVELLFEQKYQAIDALKSLTEFPHMTDHLVDLLNLYNPATGIPKVRLGSWVETNAGWGRIDGIEDPHTRMSVESFMEGQGEYRLAVLMHLDINPLTGERVYVDMAAGKIIFSKAPKLYQCPHCEGFASSKLELFRSHLNLQHDGALPSPAKIGNTLALKSLRFHFKQNKNGN